MTPPTPEKQIVDELWQSRKAKADELAKAEVCREPTIGCREEVQEDYW